MNLYKLKGKLTEKQKNYEDCAKCLNVTVATFSNKINGKGKFYIEELEMLGDFLGMSKEEKADIFLG